MLQHLLPSFSFQSLSLLAIVAGLVIVCLGMWYLWAMQQQMQTDMQYLQMQQTQLATQTQTLMVSSSSTSTNKTGSNKSGNTVTPSTTSDASVPTNAAATVTSSDANTNHTPLSSVCHRSSGLSSGTATIPEESAEDHDSSSESDYDDDDEDVDNEPKSIDTNGTTQPTSTVSAVVPPFASHPPGLVESLLSNMVTESIDQMMPTTSVTMMATEGGGECSMATTILVDATGVSSGADGHKASVEGSVDASVEASVDASVEASAEANAGFGLLSDVQVQDITELEVDGDVKDENDTEENDTNAPMSTVASADSTTSSLPENFLDCQGDPNLLTETLRAKTVAELKTLCGTCEITIKKGKSYKRKDELIESLVEKVCSSASA